MNKKISLICVMGALGASAFAAPISPQQALERLSSESRMKTRGPEVASLRLAHTSRAADGAAVAYVFVANEGIGYTILSADDVALPVLAYSNSDAFDAGNIPPQLQWWLDEMGRRISFAASRQAGASSGKVYAPEDWTEIEPLCKTKWSQEDPYNRQTPEKGGVHCPTGCVATSFAQAMNYFKYPERGDGVIQYKWNNKNLRLNLGVRAFDWDNMADTYSGSSYTEEQADAVAYLMKACGYSVEMGYDKYASGAQSYKIINALVNNFKYDPNVRYVDRMHYSLPEWSGMIYDNIKNCGPVIYDGNAIEGGHSFICDGYDGKGYFHFNWGWGGMSDGYYLLDVLNPEAQGTGGAVGGFNWSQNAVLGMRKPTGDPVIPNYGNLVQYGTTDASVNGTSIDFRTADFETLGWGNASYRDINVSVGAIFENQSTSQVTDVKGTMGSLDEVSLSVFQYFPQDRVYPSVEIPASLPDGTYKVSLATKDCEYEDAPWQPVVVTYGYCNYCLLTVKDGRYSISNTAPMLLSFEDVRLNDVIYYDKNTMLRAKVGNASSLDLSVCIQPVLTRNNAIQYTGDMMLVSANAGETADKSWIVKFHPGQNVSFDPQAAYTLELLDRTSGLKIGSFGEVRMDMASGNLSVEVDKFGVAGASVKDIQAGNRTFKNTYMVTDASDFDIELDYTVESGYFDSSLRMGVQIYDPVTNKSSMYLDEIYHDYPFLGRGEKGHVNVPMNMSTAPKNAVYTVRALYILNGVQRSMAMMTFAFDLSAIDDIECDDDSNVEYYNLQGVRLERPEKGQMVICRKGDKRFKIIF